MEEGEEEEKGHNKVHEQGKKEIDM